MKYSLTQGGVLASIAGILVGVYFSESCTNEIIGKLLPFLGALPGQLMTWIGRYRLGGVNFAGVKPARPS